MSKLPGYFFITIGIAGVVFFYTYSGTAIQRKELWIVFSVFFVIIGGFLLAKKKVEAIRRELNESRKTDDDGKPFEGKEKS